MAPSLSLVSSAHFRSSDLAVRRPGLSFSYVRFEFGWIFIDGQET